MEDLLDVQIRDSCKLAIPNGLKELMSDISREVLRAKPPNVYSFIANYLSALLVTREHMTVASHICNCVFEKELEETLINIGITDYVADAVRTITKYFDEPTVKESEILSKLTESTEKIDEQQLKAVQEAIRNIYRRHRNCREDIATKLTLLSTPDEIQEAVSHTLNLYKKCKPTEEQYNQMAVKIQAAYRAYEIRREKAQSFESFPNDWNNSYISSEFSTDSNDEFFYKGQQMSYCPSDFSFLAYKMKLAERANNNDNADSLDQTLEDQTRRCTVTFGNNFKFKEFSRKSSGSSTSKLSQSTDSAILNVIENRPIDEGTSSNTILKVPSDTNISDINSNQSDFDN